MDGMNAYRRAQYITLISEMHCLPKMASGNAIVTLSVINDYQSSMYDLCERDSRSVRTSHPPSSLLSNILLICTSLFSLSQSMTIDYHRFFACGVIIARWWMPDIIDGDITEG